MADVSVSTVIARPLTEVADYAADPDNAPEWYENIKSIEWVEVDDGHTRMTLRNRGGPALLSPLMGPAMRRANTKDLAKLKAILEASSG